MKRTLSFVLCLAFIFSMFGSVLVGTAGAAAYKDLPANHWAVNEISYMSEKAVLQGYLGSFRPGDPVTKAEFIKIENYTFGLKNTSNQAFADVSPSKWYYTDIMKAAANGYLTTKGNFVYPDAPLTREEACALIMRYLGVQPRSSYSTFSDAGQISGEYLPYVIAATENNIIKGYPDNTFRPKNTITRAEASTVFYRMAGTIYMSSSFGTDPGANPANAVINTAGITITGANLFGTVYVTEGCENGTITLRNCNIPTGTLRIRGAATVILENCTINKVEVETTSGNGSTIIASGATNVNALEARTTTTLKNNTTGGNYGFGNVFSNMSPFSTLTLDGKFPSVEVGTPNTTIALLNRDTVIENLAVRQGASNTKLTGSGTVKMANIAAPGADFSMVPEKYNIGAGLYAMFAGVKYTGSGAENVQVKFYIVNDALEIRSLNSASGLLYYVIVANNAPAPTADQVIAGVAYGATPVLHSGNIVQAANVEAVVTTAALPVNTNYDLYYYFRANGAAVSGNPTKVDIFTQNAPFFAAGYPSEGAFVPSAGGTYTKTIKVKGTGSATAYAIAVPKGSAVPTPSQVYEAARGTTSYNPAVIISSRTTAAASAAGEITLSLTGLQNAAYDYYVVLGVGASPVAIRSTAAAPPAGVPVLTIPTQLATTTSPLVLVYSEKMYYNNAPLSTVADQATLRALFPITSAAVVDVPAYTVTVADNVIAPFNTTVTIAPIAPATWKENTVYIVTPNSTITNAGGNTPVVKFGNFIVNVARPTAVLAPTVGVSTTDGILTLTYSQPMKIKTAEGGFADINNVNVDPYFTLYKSGDSTNPVAIDVTVSDDRTIFTIDPQVVLAPNTQYVIAVSESITNGAGYAPAQLTYSFTTAAQPAVATPIITVSRDSQVVTDRILDAGQYTITIIASDESTVYYTTDGTTPTAGSTKYENSFTVTLAPRKTITIKAIAIPNAGVDKASSPVAERVLEGREVIVNADIPSHTAIKNNTEVELSTNYGDYKIKYAKSDTALNEAAALTAVKAGTEYIDPVTGLNGKYLYAAAIRAGEALGPVSEFYYYDFNVTDIISPASLSFVYKNDEILIGFFNNLGEDAYPEYTYELAVTIKDGNDTEDLNLGDHNNYIYTVDGVYNKPIRVTAEVVAFDNGTKKVSFKEVAQYFANPAPIIKVKLTASGVTTEYVGPDNTDTIAYGAEAKFKSVLPILPDGFNANAMTWGVSTIDDFPPFNGEHIDATKTVKKDLSVVANANADKPVTSKLMLNFIAVPPRLLNAANEEHEAEFVYVDDGVLFAEHLEGVVNYYKINEEEKVEYNAPGKDHAFKWDDDYPGLDEVTISLWSVYTNGIADPADYRTSEVNTYVIKRNGPVFFSPDIVVTYFDNGKDVAYTEEIPVAKLGDKVTASTKVVGAELNIYHTEADNANYLAGPLGPTVTYVIQKKFTGTETDFLASIDPLGTSETVRKTVRIRPIEPRIDLIDNGTFELLISKKHEGVDVAFTGIRYTTDGSDPIDSPDAKELVIPTAYVPGVNEKLDAGLVDWYKKVAFDLSDGYHIRAVTYSENANGDRWYSAEVEKYRPNAPVITYTEDGVEYQLTTSTTQFYHIGIGKEITITADSDTLLTRSTNLIAGFADEETGWNEDIKSGETFEIPGEPSARCYFQAKVVDEKGNESVPVKIIIRKVGVTTFAPASGTPISPTGGETITITFPETAAKAKSIGDRQYFYQFSGKEEVIVDTLLPGRKTEVKAPKGTAGQTLTLTAGVRYTAKNDDGDVVFHSVISNESTYNYVEAPLFTAWYWDGTKLVEIQPTYNGGTYFDVQSGTTVFLKVVNRNGKDVYWNCIAESEPTEANQTYEEYPDGNYKGMSKISLAPDEDGITITNDLTVVYVAAKFKDGVMSRVQLRRSGSVLPIPVPVFYKKTDRIEEWSTTGFNYIHENNFATFQLFYKDRPDIKYNQYYQIGNGVKQEINTAGSREFTLNDFNNASSQVVCSIWLEDAGGNVGDKSVYTFKLVNDMNKLDEPTVTPANKSIITAGPAKISAETEYELPVVLEKNLLLPTDALTWQVYNAPENIPDTLQGRTVIYYARVRCGGGASDTVANTYYVRPIDVAGVKEFRVTSGNELRMIVKAPAVGTATGVVIKQGDTVRYWSFNGNDEINFAISDAAIDALAYYYETTNPSLLDNEITYLEPAPGIVYSKNSLQTIPAAPKVMEVKIGNRLVTINPETLTANNVLYVEGESVYAKASTSADTTRFYSTLATDKVYGRLNKVADYYDDIGNDFEILLNPKGGFAMPFKSVGAAIINANFNVISIQPYDSVTKRYGKVVAVAVVALKAPEAVDAVGNGQYVLKPVTDGYTANYVFSFKIYKLNDTASGTPSMNANPVTFDNVSSDTNVDVRDYIAVDAANGPWVLEVEITATINGIDYEKVTTNIYDIATTAGTIDSIIKRP